MPFSYSIFPDQNLVRQTLWGIVTVRDIRDITIAMRRDPHYRRRLDIIADLRNATADISHNDMLELAGFLSGHSEIGRQAIVVSNQLEFGMARMFEQLTEEGVQRIDLKVFFDMDEAEQWLGLGNPGMVQAAALSARAR